MLFVDEVCIDYQRKGKARKVSLQKQQGASCTFDVWTSNDDQNISLCEIAHIGKGLRTMTSLP